jgi:hypothetical protein
MVATKGDGIDLGEREMAFSAGSQQIASSASLAALEGSAASSAGGASTPSKKSGNFRGRAVRFGKQLLKRKWTLAGGGGLVVIAIFILFFLLSFLKIPDLAADITAVEFSRLIRQFDTSAQRVINDALAYQTSGIVDGKSVSLREQLRGEYADEERVLTKLLNLRPGKIAGNLGIADNLRLNYDSSGKILRSVSLLDDGGAVLRSVDIAEPSALSRIIPGWRFFTRTLSGRDSRTASQLADLVSEGLTSSGVRGVGLIIRGSSVSEALRQAIGANLLAFDGAALAKYAKMSRSQAYTTELRESQQAISGGTVAPSDGAVVPENAEIADEAAAKFEEDVDQLGEVVNGRAVTPDRIVQDVGQTSGKKIEGGLLKKIAKVGDPLYLLALTMCTIYDGSMEKAGPAINTNATHQRRTFYRIASIADQEESGGPVGLANAVGAANDQVGDTAASIPYQKASGISVKTDDSIMSAETDGLGGYTLLNATFGQDALGQGIANLINSKAEPLCKGLLSPVAVIGFIGAQLVILGVSLGSSAGGTAAVDAGVEGATEAITGEAATQIATRVTARSVASVVGQKIATGGFWKRIGLFVAKEGVKLGGIVAGTDALTWLAKTWVYSHSGYMWSGLEGDTDLADAAGAGGNLVANDHEQTMLFGRPLTCKEIGQNDQLDKGYLAAQEQNMSFSDRYLSANNPRSLLMQTATMVYANTHGIFSSHSTLANIFSMPLQFLGSTVASITGTANAATPCAQQDYGNVQFGWSNDEEALINSSDSYSPLQNQKILDQSGQEKSIAKEYSYCFGYDYNDNGDGNIDPSDPSGNLVLDITGENAQEGKDGSIGGLLSNGDIVRTSDGDVVVDKGNCSPQNLSYKNPKFGDLVFRWRLAMRYDNTLDQLTNMQTVE